MALNTSITRMLGIRHPIIQGGMNYAGSARLSAAVANAGGLGLISALTQPSGAALRSEIRAAREMIAPDGPGALGVNLSILPTKFEEERGLYDEYISAIIEEGVGVVETSGPRPPSCVFAKLKRHGIKIIHKCVSTRAAHTAEALGADAIALDGFECAGTPGNGDVSNWVLQALGARELSVPFVASGGIGDGRQLAAALTLGAAGVTMGTRFMATAEAPIDNSIKHALVDAGVGTMIARPNTKAPDPRPHGVRLSVWSCGPVMALIDDVPTCEVLIERMVAEAVCAIEEVTARVGR
jgi:nitronate monooxygenase